MRYSTSLFLVVCCVLSSAVLSAEDEIDWRKTQDLYNRSQRGEKLSDDDQKYLDHAKVVRQQFIAKGEAPWKNVAGNAGRPAANITPREKTGMAPLTELGTEKYKGEDGGLYGGGKNEPPAEHLAAVMNASRKSSRSAKRGSPPRMEKSCSWASACRTRLRNFRCFKQSADNDADKAGNLVIVDGAQAARREAVERRSSFQVVEQRLANQHVTAEQVQVAWVKQANMGPRGELQEHGKELQKDMEVLLRLLKKHYPNLQARIFVEPHVRRIREDATESGAVCL